MQKKINTFHKSIQNHRRGIRHQLAATQAIHRHPPLRIGPIRLSRLFHRLSAHRCPAVIRQLFDSCSIMTEQMERICRESVGKEVARQRRCIPPTLSPQRGGRLFLSARRRWDGGLAPGNALCFSRRCCGNAMPGFPAQWCCGLCPRRRAWF